MEYPITVEGDWGTENAKSVKNKLHIHFQSKKKSQGGDCVVQYNGENNSATILFKSSDIRDAVLLQEEHIITIDSQKIKLKVYKPSDVQEDSTGLRVEQACGYQEPNQNASQTDLDVKKPQESSAVVLEDLPDEFKQDVVTLLVENITNLSENDFTMELIPELRKAVVTFKNPNHAVKFLEDSRTHKKFKRNDLRARALERSTCVRVENLPAEANNNKMLLELYFEKWGGPVEEVITIPAEQAAMITFEEEEAKERILKQENNICEVPVKIYPYFKSLDTVLYGGNRPHLKLPEPITVSVHPAIRKFLLMKAEISSISDQMSSHFCKINMDKPEALLSPDPALLKQKGVTRRHIDDWSKNACDAFKKIISNYTTSEWPVSHPLWSKVESDVKELVKDKVFTDMDASKGVLTLAGMTHEITGLKPIMEKIIERATNQLEREKNSVTEHMEIQVDQACGYQEPNQNCPQTDLDVKKPQESSAVVLEDLPDLPDEFKQDVVTLLVENITRLSENDFTMELIPELRKAVVTFKNPNDAVKFLEDSRTHKKFKKNDLRARALERSTCVRVENLPAEANNNKMLLELYFEKWGGPVEEVITIPAEQAAIITFEEEEAKERILKQENNICEVPVKIYPYFKSLDTVLYGGNRPHLKLPEPITVSVHPAIRKFLLKKGLISSISDQVSSHFCKINMDKPEALLSPDPALLKQKGVTRRHIDGWSKNACDAFKKIISNYTTSEWPVSQPLWSKVESDVKELVKDKVFTDMDTSKGVLTLAGMTHEITGLKPIMEKIIERATNQLEREDDSVTEHMEISPAMYSLLLQDGLKTAVSPQMHIDYDKTINSLVLAGLHTDIIMFKNWVLVKKLSMKQKPLKIDRSVLEFLRSVNCDEMSTDLFISHRITAVYTIENGDVVVIGSTEKALVEAEKRVNMVLASKELIIEDQGVLQMPEWQDLKKQVQELFNTSKKKSVFINHSQRGKIIVTGFRDPVMEVSDNLGRFFEKHTRIEETVRVKSHAAVEFIKERKSQDWQHLMKSEEVQVNFDSKRPWIKLSGGRKFVQPVLKVFKRLIDALYTDTLIIKKAGAKKYFKEQGKIMLSMLLKDKRYVVVLQEDDMLEEEEVDSNGSNVKAMAQAVRKEFAFYKPKMTFPQQNKPHWYSNYGQGFRGLGRGRGRGNYDQSNRLAGRVSSPSLRVHTMQLGRVTLEVSSGDITKEKTDAIVNSSNQTFSLKAGVSKAILDAAGLQVEQECLQIVRSSKMQQTEIVTSAGLLPCGNIIHIIGRNGPSDIKDVVFSVLKLCESRQITSVAFPALGTGLGGAKPGDVADAMVDAVVDFVKKTKPVHVKFVKFLIFQTNMLADFHQSMVRRSGEKVEEDEVLFTKIKESPSNEEFVMVGEEIEPAVFQLCGETQEDLNEARDMINSLILRERLIIPIRDPAIAHFTKEDVEILNGMQREFTIKVQLEKKGQDSVVTLEGLTRDVHGAESRIRDIIRKVERNENRRHEALMIGSVVKWQYQEKGHSIKSFDMLTNYDLEKAFQNRQPSVRIKINNDDYEANLVHKEATRGRVRIELNRVDLQDAAPAQSSLPSHWEDMKGKSVVLVKLTSGSNEYKDVEKEFRRTGLTPNIIEIERVQNSTLWRNYMIKKEDLEDKNKHKKNEKRLFHGTGPDKTDQINHHGFNRSYAGAHGAMYGNGSYFAVDPSYSARGYSKPDVKGHKRMYLARVLVGDFTQGIRGLPVPPAKSSNSADLYNSVTDNIHNPTMFVIFNDVQAYPEYLITFQ
ncbi:poly [ADP-ribose] polymerase [Pimephales promelas]|nr:poly [ADP-ribose] polymerase [Pimephales promelas]